MKRRKPRSATEIDEIIGKRILTRRDELGFSQKALAALIGVTFKQIQKYEKGVNRIPASRLLATAHVLKRSINYFFEPLRNKAKPRRRPYA